ncbi:hypothetical protein BC827DRAFT_1174603 [Russula dissimulans]|nr:hypothetical protein BC827DRAFT_1174603 [Russula dissimulans]
MDHGVLGGCAAASSSMVPLPPWAQRPPSRVTQLPPPCHLWQCPSLLALFLYSSRYVSRCPTQHLPGLRYVTTCSSIPPRVHPSVSPHFPVLHGCHVSQPPRNYLRWVFV